MVDIPSSASSTSDPSPSSPSPSNPTPSSAHPTPTPTLYFDPHWLAILRSTAPYLSLRMQATSFPPLDEVARKIDDDFQWVTENVGSSGLMKIEEVQQFVKTALAQEDWEAQGGIRMRTFLLSPSLAVLRHTWCSLDCHEARRGRRINSRAHFSSFLQRPGTPTLKPSP
jgi:hypothetical protein